MPQPITNDGCNDSIHNWQLRRCDNPWKPNVLNGQSEVYRRMLGILNRVTQHSLPVLLHQALELPITDPEHLQSILELLLLKSQDEPLFIPTYSLLCFELSQRLDLANPLASACESHFTKSLENILCYGNELQAQITMNLIEEEILARKRFAGHIRFVCALERKGLVPVTQLVAMGETLLAHGDLRSLECLCRLLSFAGARISAVREDVVDQCCTTLQNHLNSGELPARLKYLLQDTLELRANGWRPRVPPRAEASASRNVRG